MDFIKVTYDVYNTSWSIQKALKELSNKTILSFDTESRSVYDKEQRKEAKELLKLECLDKEIKKFALQVENSSGLSFPSLIKVTHFIFGISNNHSIILIAETPNVELLIWNWLAKYPRLILVHNSLHDFKIMYHRVKAFPKHYIDTAIRAKCLINHADVWRAKVGLKELMGVYYDPKWVLMNDYEPEDLKDPDFLDYSAIDGAATYKLHEDINITVGDR